METRGVRGQCPDSVHVKEEPEHPPPPACKPTIPCGNLYHLHDVRLGDRSTMTTEAHVEVHMKEEQEFCTDEVVHVKEEPSVPCSEIEGEGCSGVSKAAMRAGLYADHIIKDELVLGPERPHRPTLLSSPPEHIKEEQEFCMDEVVHVKEEPSVPCSETEGEGCSGVSEAAMRAGLYADHIIKDELVLGPERPHRPTLLSSPPAAAPDEDSEKDPVGASATSGEADDGFKYEVALEPTGCLLPVVTLPASSHVLRALLDGVTPHNPDATPMEHTQSHQNNDTRGTDVCPTCGSTYRHKRSFIRHINSCQRGDLNTSEKPYVCGTCNKRFAQLTNLSNHMRVHAGLITCGTCQRAFSTLTHLRRHQVIHTGETHSCTTCKAEFSSMYDLKLHRRTHSVHVCKVCNRAFSTLANLNIHELIHTGEKPHACRICKTRFRQKSTLNNHMRVHTGEKPYSCDVCNKTFKFLGNLKQHRPIHFRMR